MTRLRVFHLLLSDGPQINTAFVHFNLTTDFNKPITFLCFFSLSAENWVQSSRAQVSDLVIFFLTICFKKKKKQTQVLIEWA